MGAEILIGGTLDRCVDKRNEHDEPQPSREVKMQIGKESRAATRVSEMGLNLGHREQAPLKA